MSEGLRTNVKGSRLDTLAGTIDMTTRFDKCFGHNQEVHRSNNLLVFSTKFKKSIFTFKGPQKP